MAFLFLMDNDVFLWMTGEAENEVFWSHQE